MYYVIRFLADNPGVWLFYCHIDWHMMQGLAMTFIEAPRELQDNLVIPDDHIKVCEAAGVPYQGNAAANTEDCRNLKGENKPPGFIPAGFTAPGIAALVFSCICPIMGMVAISIYGMSGLKSPVRKPGFR